MQSRIKACSSPLAFDITGNLPLMFIPKGGQGTIMAMTFATDELKLACMGDSGIMNILTEIRLRATAGTYGTPGPTSLDAHARHHHITNRTGIAWVYQGDGNADQQILALGAKHNRNTGRGDSGYDWDSRGRI